MSNYSELLRNPKWQKKRLEIMSRDNFQCQVTFFKDKPLCVHHKRYIKGRKPWEYEDEDLITVTEDIHKAMHKLFKTNNSFADFAVSLECTSTDIYILVSRVDRIVGNEGKHGIKAVIQLLTAYIITEEEM